MLSEKTTTIPRDSADKERSILRWGGLAGILAGAFLMVTIVTLIAFGPSTTATPAQLVANFPNVRTALVVGNFFYFLVSVSLVGLTLGIYQALRKSNPLAIFGTVLFLLGIGVTFAEDTTQVAFDPISNLYHAPGATAADQHTLSLIWQATQGMFNQFDVGATLLLSTGLIVLGVAMFRTPSFGKIFGGLSMAFGAAQIVGISFVSTNSAAYAPFALLAFFIFPVVFGLKVYRLSKKSELEPVVSSTQVITRASANA
jgi:Domain of unknown function (DUF4386)